MAKLHAITPDALVKALMAAQPAHVTDGMGLFLLMTGGQRRGSWLYEYKSPITGKRTKMSFGESFLPPNAQDTAEARKVAAKAAITWLADVRAEHAQARAKVDAGICPRAEREQASQAQRAAQEAHLKATKEAKRREAAGLPQAGTFRDWADRYHASRVELGQNASTYLREFGWTMEKHAFPYFGDKQIGDVSSLDIAAMDNRLADKPHARLKARRFARSVFNWAMHPKNGHAVRTNPVYEDDELYMDLHSAPRANVIRDDAMTAEEMTKAVQRLVRSMDAYTPPKGNHTLKNALWLQCLTFQRPGQIAAARKEDFDLSKGLWTVPAWMMKGRTSWKKSAAARPHLVYLSPLAVRILRDQFEAFPESVYVFPGQGKAARTHMCASSLNRLLHVMGYGGEQTAHGFRAIGRTLGAEVLGINEIVLEKILAHRAALLTQNIESGNVVPINARDGGMAGVYDQTQFLDARQMAAVIWSDFIDGLRDDPGQIEQVA